MRILFTGAAPWCNGSYGKPLRYLIPLLSERGHQCAIACFYGFAGGVADTNIGDTPVRLYPVVREKYLNDIIDYHAKDWDADVVISFQDIWPCSGWGYFRKFAWIPWMPVDTAPVTQQIRKALEGCFLPASYSQWGRDQLIEAGWPTARYIPIGLDLEIHRPMDQAAARAKIGLPVNGFIAGMVAANAAFPSRKSFPEVLMAWKQWTENGGKGLLYLHTTVTPRRDAGIDFVSLLQRLGINWSTLDDPIPERKELASVFFPSQYRMWCHAVDDAELATIYNCLDVLLHPSMSEGFGMPLTEAQACGVPVVTVNFSSQKELTFSGLCLEPVQETWDSQNGWRGIAPVGELVDAISWARDMSEGEKARKYLSEKARAGVEQFDWTRTVDEYWEPLLGELQ